MRTLRDIQQAVDTLIKEEWHSDYWAPLSSLARLQKRWGSLRARLMTLGEETEENQ